MRSYYLRSEGRLAAVSERGLRFQMPAWPVLVRPRLLTGCTPQCCCRVEDAPTPCARYSKPSRSVDPISFDSRTRFALYPKGSEEKRLLGAMLLALPR